MRRRVPENQQPQRVLFSAAAILLLACSPLSQSASSSGGGTGGASSVSGATGSGTSGGTGGGPTTESSSKLLGIACASDNDCGVLKCIQSTDDDPVFEGGPAGGFCTKECKTDADCPGTSSTCLQSADGMSGRCTLRCTLGPKMSGLEGPFDPDKCRGRDDLRCSKVKGNLAGTVCVPSCGRDAQCGPGRSCDPRRAVCVETPSVGLPTGALCDPKTPFATCAGLCIGFTSGDARCTSPCVLGDALIDSDNCGGPDQGICAFGPNLNGVGDFGFCTRSCAAQDECMASPFFCFAVPPLTDTLGKGYCFAATACPNGQGQCIDADGKPTGQTCTDTKFGPYCLDTLFPLGDAAPTGTGGGGAGGAPTTSGAGGAPTTSGAGGAMP